MANRGTVIMLGNWFIRLPSLPLPTGLDPLSPATRAVKRNLLVASVLAITIKAFDVTIDKIPLGSLSITFDNRVFVFLLLISLTYFFVIFLLYYFIDIRNVEDTPLQTQREAMLPTALDNFPIKYQQRILDYLNGKYPGVLFSTGQESIANALGLMHYRPLIFGPLAAHWWWPERLRRKRKENYGKRVVSKRLYHPLKSPRELLIMQVRHEYEDFGRVPQTTEEFRALNLGAARFLRQEMRRYRSRYELFARSERARLKAMRAIYFIRNYGTDGLVPIALALVAFGVLYEWIPVDWLRHIAPPK